MGPCTGSQNGHTTAVNIYFSDKDVISTYIVLQAIVHGPGVTCPCGLHNIGICACLWWFIMSF